MPKKFAFAAAVFFCTVTSHHVLASPGGDSPLTKAFGDCMLSKAKTGSYTSGDGGKSAIRLMTDCKAQWKAWQDKCMADGESDGDCSVKAGELAQGAIIITEAAAVDRLRGAVESAR